jgi:hypothetical protein
MALAGDIAAALDNDNMGIPGLLILVHLYD